VFDLQTRCDTAAPVGGTRCRALDVGDNKLIVEVQDRSAIKCTTLLLTQTARCRGSAYRDALRRFTRPTVSPDGKRVAVEVRELRVVVARVRFQGLNTVR
jgi:hypothetical protein